MSSTQFGEGSFSVLDYTVVCEQLIPKSLTPMTRPRHIFLAPPGMAASAVFLLARAFAAVAELVATTQEKHPCGRAYSFPALAGVFLAILPIWAACSLEKQPSVEKCLRQNLEPAVKQSDSRDEQT